MAQQLGSLAALAEDPSLGLFAHVRWLTITCHCSTKASDVLFEPLQAPGIICTHPHNEKQILKKKKKNQGNFKFFFFSFSFLVRGVWSPGPPDTRQTLYP